MLAGDDGKETKIHLDYNGTTPMLEEVKLAIKIAMDQLWANPSSGHQQGKLAKEAIGQARQNIKDLLECPDDSDVYFTSGGTESNNWVIYSHSNVLSSPQSMTKPHIVTSNIEHDSVELLLSHLESMGKIDVTRVPVSMPIGSVRAEDVVKAVQSNTTLITIMLANNETGVLQPVKEIIERLKAEGHNIPVHTDASQVIGKMPISVMDLGVDYLTVVGHKFYGPRIGALFVRRTTNLHPLFFGGGQESGMRPGTENTPMIVGLGKAAKAAADNCGIWIRHISEMAEYLELRLKEIMGNDRVHVNFSESAKLPNTKSIAFPKMRCTGAELLARCQLFAAATGAACHSNKTSASKILLKSGVSHHLALRTIRFSVGISTTKEHIDSVVNEIANVTTGETN